MDNNIVNNMNNNTNNNNISKKRGRPPKTINSSDTESKNSDINNNEPKKKGRKPKYSSDEERRLAKLKYMNEKNKRYYRENEDYRNKLIASRKDAYIKKDILDYKSGRPKNMEESEIDQKEKLFKKLKNSILQIMRFDKKSNMVDENVMANIKNFYKTI
jgi:hypothetical protein